MSLYELTQIDIEDYDEEFQTGTINLDNLDRHDKDTVIDFADSIKNINDKQTLNDELLDETINEYIKVKGKDQLLRYLYLGLGKNEYGQIK